MNPWMQDNTESRLELRTHAKEAFARLKDAPARTLGTVLIRAAKLTFVVSAGVVLALLKLATATARTDEDEYTSGIHPYDPNGDGDYANLSSLADKANAK